MVSKASDCWHPTAHTSELATHDVEPAVRLACCHLLASSDGLDAGIVGGRLQLHLLQLPDLMRRQAAQGRNGCQLSCQRGLICWLGTLR